MKIIYSFCVFLAIFVNGSAQNASNPCNIEYSVDIKKAAGNSYSSTMIWDFPSLQTTTKASVEVMPILDCWNELSGQQLKALTTFEVDATGKGSAELSPVHGISAKCFKWRVRVKTDACEETSEWKYSEIVPKKSK